MKKIVSIILCLLLLVALPCSVFATGINRSPIVDGADLLTDREEQNLEDAAAAFYERYGIWIAIVTTNSLGNKSAERYADDFYDNNYYGTYKDGILLLISMEYRDWAISTCGRAIEEFSDWDLDSIFEAMSWDLSHDRFYDAFETFLEVTPSYLSQPKGEADLGDFIRIVVVSLVVGAVVGGLVILVMRGNMNSVQPKTNAADYIVPGSYQLKKHMDIFLYSRVTRVRRAENSGGSAHRSSGGIRHGGRSGKF